MNVADLIATLEAMPKDAEVRIYDTTLVEPIPLHDISVESDDGENVVVLSTGE